MVCFVLGVLLVLLLVRCYVDCSLVALLGCIVCVCFVLLGNCCLCLLVCVSCCAA